MENRQDYTISRMDIILPFDSPIDLLVNPINPVILSTKSSHKETLTRFHLRK